MIEFRFLKNIVHMHLPLEYEYLNSTLEEANAPIRYGPPMRGDEFYPLPHRSPIELMGTYTPEGQGMEVTAAIKAYREKYGMKEPTIPLLEKTEA